MKIKFLKLFIFLAIFFALPHFASATSLSLTDTGTGENRVVTIESAGQFRLAFEAVQNYGLSKWYDLVNDPGMVIDLAQSHDIIIASGRQPSTQAESGSLFTQVFTHNDEQTGIKFISPFAYVPTLEILENTNLRVVIKTVQTPRISTTVFPEITTTTTYYIYPDGKIYVNCKTHINTGFDNTSQGGSSNYWRVATLQLLDPSTACSPADGICRNSADTGTPDYFGWIRSGAKWNSTPAIGGTATDQSPLLNWYNGSTKWKYLYMYWKRDAAAYSEYTYPDFTIAELDYSNGGSMAINDFIKANIAIIPSLNNDPAYQGAMSTHGNWGYKRLSYTVGSPAFTTGQDIVQDYLIQLGTSGSSVLPDITSASAVDTIANAYLADPIPPSDDTTAPASPSGLSVE